MGKVERIGVELPTRSKKRYPQPLANTLTSAARFPLEIFAVGGVSPVVRHFVEVAFSCVLGYDAGVGGR